MVKPLLSTDNSNKWTATGESTSLILLILIMKALVIAIKQSLAESIQSASSFLTYYSPNILLIRADDKIIFRQFGTTYIKHFRWILDLYQLASS